MTDEKLIEEAAKAIAAYDAAGTDVAKYHTMKAATESLRNLLAVFEKAHAPTDDERGALAVIVAYVEDDYQREHGTLNGSAMATAEAILAAGFRRSEVPEPQGEPSDAQVRAAAESLAHSAGYVPEPMVRAALRAARQV